MKRCPACNQEFDGPVVFCPFDGQALSIQVVLDGKYRLEEMIGEGGMGKVYRATHIHIGNDLAVKVLHPHLFSHHTSIERFRREARATAQINHPNAVVVTDFGVIKETKIVYLVMEFLKGVSLRERLKARNHLEGEEAHHLLQQICGAVQAAHSKGIIHRDLKPDNIFLVKGEDGVERVKVLDFGIAKLKDGVSGGNITEAGVAIGTPKYMSPEQCLCEELDARSDVYSLGVILYEMLTGSTPFSAGASMAVMIMQTQEKPRSIRELKPDISEQIERVVMRALEKDRELRQKSAMMLAEEFEAALQAVSASRASPVAYEPPLLHTAPLSERDPYSRKSRNPVFGAVAGESFPDGKAPIDDAAVALAEKTPQNLIKPLKPSGDSSVEDNSEIFGETIEEKVPKQQKREEPPVVQARTSDGIWKRDANVGNASSFDGGAKKLFMISAAVLAVAMGLLYSYNLFSTKLTEPPQPKQIEQSVEPPPGMVFIPGGKFVMGNNNSTEEFEKPEHEVTINPFFIDRFEVTNEDYYKFVKATNHKPPPSWEKGKYLRGKERYPVTEVSWFDAQAFADWAGKRLPTEEEWEYASRGADKRLYPWGDGFDASKLNSSESNRKEPMSVGSFPSGASPFNVMDMAGNVDEWTASDAKPYPGAKTDSQNGKIVRGGSYYTDRVIAMTTTRSIESPKVGDYSIGFRCVKDLSSGEIK